MEQLWEYFYSLMLLDISRCDTTASTETQRSECSYEVAVNYWQKVRDNWRMKLVYTDEEEITFFRDVKPQFTSHVEYYLILNQGLLFIPDHPSEAYKYWQEEEKRYQRFYKRNETFIRYLENKYHDNDRDYFLERNNRHTILAKERIYGDADCRSSHDSLIRSWLANKRYNEFVKHKLSVLHDG